VRSETPNDTITAISTTAGQAAIGIVRLSGPHSIEIASKILKPSSQKTLIKQPTFSILHGVVFDGRGNRLDEVLVSLMRGPKSYTAEDVVEINCHGGPMSLRSVLELVLENGARLAEPGEFTKRAYLNGRIDLTQAEAVADIISAKTKLALKSAQGQLEGKLSVAISRLKERLIDIMAQLQAAIDFSDEEIEPDAYPALLRKLDAVKAQLEALISTKADGQLLREGIKTAIVGGPNVGKSSLLNALLQRERAIVTEIAGTTRDMIEEIINVRGLPLVLQDTAGIREAFDGAEKKGIEISLRALEQADLVLLVIDSTKPLGNIERKLAKKARDKKRIIVLNKSDLKPIVGAPELKTIGLNDFAKVSALKLTGLDKLKEKIVKLCFGHVEPEELLVTSIRQARALEEGLERLNSARELLKKGESEEIISLEINFATESLGQVLGEISAEDVLEAVFSRFCIGK